MGRYVTTTSISVLMPRWLVGNTTTSDTTGLDIFSAATDYAEGKVNSAIVIRYDPAGWTTTGNPGIPPEIRGISADIACYRAIRASNVQDSQLETKLLADFEAAKEELELIALGKHALAFTDGSLVATRTAGRYQSNTENYTEIFGLDTDTAWIRDTDEISDQSAARE